MDQGPFFNFNQELVLETFNSIDFTITVDKMQQHLIYNSVTLGDCDFFNFMNVACNGLSFTLGRVLNVDNDTVSIQIYISDSNGINGIWSEESGLTKQIPELLCFSKKLSSLRKIHWKKDLRLNFVKNSIFNHITVKYFVYNTCFSILFNWW